MRKPELQSDGLGSASPARVSTLASVSMTPEERDEDVVAYATAEEFWRRRERNRMMSPASPRRLAQDESRKRGQAISDACTYDDNNANFFLHFMTSLNRFVDASREVERCAASTSKALARMRSHRRLHAGSVDDSAHKEVEALLLRVDTLKQRRSRVNELLPRVSSLVVVASEPSASSSSHFPTTTTSGNLHSSATTHHGGGGSHGTDLEEKLRRVGDGINRLAAGTVHHVLEGEPASSGQEDSRLSATPDGTLATQTRVHDTHEDINRLRSEYLYAVQQIKTSHDRHVRLLQKQQNEEVARLGDAHDLDKKREMRAQEDATLRLLKRLGVSGDAISTFVEGLADAKRGHAELNGSAASSIDTDPHVSAFTISQTLAKERQKRRELEAKLDTVETDASTARDYALFRQRQEHDMKIAKLERDHDEAHAHQASEAAASIEEALAPAQNRIRNLRCVVKRNTTNGATDYCSTRSPLTPSSSSSSLSQQSNHDECDDNEMTVDSSTQARISKVTDALIRGLSKLEEEVRSRVGGERGRDTTTSGAAVDDGTAPKNVPGSKRGQSDVDAETHDISTSRIITRRTCRREQEYDELLSELRALEKSARASEHKSLMRAAARSTRQKGTKRVSIGISEPTRKHTNTEKKYESGDTLKDDIADVLTVSSSSEEGGAMCVDEANMTPPQPRRFLPAAVSGDRRRRIRRKEAESDTLHPGIARLLLKSSSSLGF